MIVAWEQRTECTVNKSASEDFLIAWLAFTACKTSRESAVCRIFLTILYLEWHKICSWYGIFGCTNSGQEHSVAHAEHHGTIGLFGKLSCLNADFASVRQ